MRKLKIYSLVVLAAIAVILFVPAHGKAQSKPVQSVQPVFDGSEKNIADTVASVADAIQDTVLKAKLQAVADKLDNPPGDNASFVTWVSYIIGLIGLAFGIYHYVQRRLQSKPS